jgi:hypothetical protein
METLKKYTEIKMIWQTYGTCNLVAVLFCSEGDEGKTIFQLGS